MSPLYDITCPKCGYKIEALMSFDAPMPLCIQCNVPMERSYGSLAYFVMKGEIQGSTPGIRKRAEEITRKTRR